MQFCSPGAQVVARKLQLPRRWKLNSERSENKINKLAASCLAKLPAKLFGQLVASVSVQVCRCLCVPSDAH